MDPTQVPAQAIDPNAIKVILARLFGGAAQAGPPTFPATGGKPPAQGASPAGMTQPQAAQPPGATAQTGIPAMATAGNPPSPTGMTQPKPAAAAPNPAGMTRPASAGSVSHPGPTAGGLPQPTGAKKEAVGTTEEGFPSESAWGAAHPTPQQPPYVEPDLKHRMLMGLFSGMMNIGDRGSGSQALNQYANRIYQGEQRNLNAPADAAAAAHQRYQSYIQGQEGPLQVANLQQQLSDRRAAAKLRPTGAPLAQQYADAVDSGDEAGAAKYLGAIKAQAGASAKPVIETLSQRYADAVDKGDTPRATKLLAGLQALTKAQTKAPAPKVPTSEGGMMYADWRRENPRAPVSDYLGLKNEPKDAADRAKNLDDLRKERDAVQKTFEARITAVTTSPQDAQRLQGEEQQQLGTYDRQIHNFEQGYRVGDIVPYQNKNMKISRILPDGRLQLEPATSK
ncbi:MAG TPA: hypothetical protein VNI36_05930 [Candidatus Dormibacteraeota bacterium]|nr:hypothetical protein [Candidatus Dormibacteraeota bacterium]